MRQARCVARPLLVVLAALWLPECAAARAVGTAGLPRAEIWGGLAAAMPAGQGSLILDHEPPMRLGGTPLKSRAHQVLTVETGVGLGMDVGANVFVNRVFGVQGAFAALSLDRLPPGASLGHASSSLEISRTRTRMFGLGQEPVAGVRPLDLPSRLFWLNGEPPTEDRLCTLSLPGDLHGHSRPNRRIAPAGESASRLRGNSPNWKRTGSDAGRPARRAPSREPAGGLTRDRRGTIRLSRVMGPADGSVAATGR